MVCLTQWRQHGVGEARLAFLWRSVAALRKQLAELGIPLSILSAAEFTDIPEVLATHAKAVRASAVVFNREYPLNERQRDRQAATQLRKEGIDVVTFDGNLIQPPGSVLTQQATPYTVFTPFKRRWLNLTNPPHIVPMARPTVQATPLPTEPAKLRIEPWKDVDQTLLAELWPAGEREALQRLAKFLNAVGPDYAEQRDFPALPGTSTLSPYLAVGAISPRQCLDAALRVDPHSLYEGPMQAWTNELIWREFYKHIVILFPQISRGENFNARYNGLPWRHAPDELEAWQRGRTGYPIVDAAMQQLNQTGWMHNRLRMITAMFLAKHLLIDWREGEAYFMQKLVDGDFAANNGGWQWSASTGTDAAPYFRIFNPTTQGRKFDKRGLFTRAQLPALAEVSNKYLYTPHEEGKSIDYPLPIVEHRFARERAIATFKNWLELSQSQ